MPALEKILHESKDVIREQLIDYKPNAETLGKNFKRTLFGICGYFFIKHLGPDSNFLFETMTWTATNAMFIYAAARAYQTARDFIDYV